MKLFDKLKQLFNNIKCKFSCLSSCCNTSCCNKTDVDIDIDVDGDGKDDIHIGVHAGTVEIDSI
jgi:hypothetical protein